MLSSKLTLTMAASFYAHKSSHPTHHNLNSLFHTIINNNRASIPRAAASSSSSSSSSLAVVNGGRERNSAFYKDGWWLRLSTCAYPVHDITPPPKLFLGFRAHYKCFSSSSSSSPGSDNNNKSNSSSTARGGGLSDSGSSSSSKSSGSGFMDDMGLESKEHCGWYESGLQGQEPYLSMNHQQEKEQQRGQEQSSKLLTLPTILTLGRVAAVPLFLCTFYVDSWWGTTATTSIFIAAAITDWLDGYLARKMKLGSAFGAFLDPVADKLMVAAALVLLCTRPLGVPMFAEKPWLLTVPAIAIIGREITMSAVREWAASQDSKLLEAVAVNNLGKWKTATQMTALTILLATRDSSIGGPGLVTSGVILLYVSAGLALWSLVVYIRKISRVLLR